MKHFTSAWSFLMSFMVPTLLSAAPDGQGKSDSAANAALIYRAAFDDCDDIAKDENIAKAIEHFGESQINGQLRAALENERTLDLFHLASNIEHCDWGLRQQIHELGPRNNISHLKRCRQLARVGLLRARIHLHDNKPARAFEDLMAVYRLARHSQVGDLELGMLVGISIDMMAHQTIAENIESFDAPTLRRLLEGYAKLPEMMHPKTAILGLRDGYGGWVKRTMVKPDYKDVIARSMKVFADSETDTRLVMLSRLSQSRMNAMSDGLLDYCTALAKDMELPPDKFDYEAAEKKVLHPSPGKAPRILRKKYSSSRYP